VIDVLCSPSFGVPRESVCGWKAIRPSFFFVWVLWIARTGLEKFGTERVVVDFVRGVGKEGRGTVKVQW
jgi:hypothetical protein